MNEPLSSGSVSFFPVVLGDQEFSLSSHAWTFMKRLTCEARPTKYRLKK